MSILAQYLTGIGTRYVKIWVNWNVVVTDLQGLLVSRGTPGKNGVNCHIHILIWSPGCSGFDECHFCLTFYSWKCFYNCFHMYNFYLYLSSTSFIVQLPMQMTSPEKGHFWDFEKTLVWDHKKKAFLVLFSPRWHFFHQFTPTFTYLWCIISLLTILNAWLLPNNDLRSPLPKDQVITPKQVQFGE